jgi:tetratricopeptide (TPR) repeat protein
MSEQHDIGGTRSSPDESPQALLTQARRRQHDGWAGPQPERVEEILAAFPSLRRHADEILDLIDREIREREARGEQPALAEYCQRFPELAGLLSALFQVHEMDAKTLTTGPGEERRSWRPLSEPEPEVPTCPGHQILGEIGRGGMGVVYKARHLALNRLVALKMIRHGAGASGEERDRFRLEAEAAARLTHPHIVRIYEVGEHQGQPFFSMEWIEGQSLASKLAGTPLTAPTAAGIVQSLARAVHAAHQAGIVHRDLKPGNVLLDAAGVPRVVDFGLAKRIDVEGMTGSGAVLGTPSYMPPEQAAGKSKEVGPTADTYALGAILYECLTGRPPFKGESALETILLVVTDDPVPPRRLNPRTPLDLENICLKCLEKLPSKRYASAEALADDLGRFLEGRPVQARAAGVLEQAVKWVRRRPVVAALLALVALLTVVGAASFGWAYHQALGQRDRAIKAEGERQVELSRVLAGSARLAARRGDWEGALRDYQAALKLGADDEVGLRLGMLECRTALYQIPQFREELAALSALPDAGPHTGTVLLLEGYDALASGRTVDKALPTVRRALEHPLPAAEEAYARALLAPTMVEATKHLQEAIRGDPTHRRSLELLAPLLFLQGQLTEARETIVQLQAAAPNSQSGLVTRALLLAQAGEVKAALRLCDRLEPVYGKEGTSLYRDLVVLTAEWTAESFLWGRHSPKQTTEKWMRFVGLVPRISRLSKGAEQGTAAAWNDFLVLRLPCVQGLVDDPGLKALRGLEGLLATLTAPGKLPEALARLARGWPNGYFHWVRAVYLLRQEKHAEAEKAMLLALATPSFMRLERRVRFELMRTRADRAATLKGPARQELEAQARKDLHRLVALGGEYPAWANYELSRVARALGDEAPALAAAKVYERQSGGKPRAAEPLFTTEFHLGAYAKAAATARRLRQVAPNDTEAANWVGRAEYERRYYRAALAAWLETIRIDPDNKTARENLIVLEGRVRSAITLNHYLLERLRLKEALILARRGRHAAAVQLARRLTAPNASGHALLVLACVEALASDAARRDTELSEDRQADLAERYARNAVDSLTTASEKGYFKDRMHVVLVNTEDDLAPLRGRADFKELSRRFP